ncbi:MAG: galactitol-1-phosphate 5-dehydrogenase [Puniceicoccaceae bacterium]|nr:MAG: galactitol-1-phosphate 5-dehydrogenase [Puniceicoccaceae bacterium]
MKALVLESPGRLVFHADHAQATESTAADSVLVRVAACGICGSDIPRAFDAGGAYHYPLVLGHEFSAVVEEDGPGVRRGDRVAVFPLLPRPGQPEFDTGDFAQTSNYDYFGSRRDGGMQEWLRVPVANLFALPDEVRLLHAACTEPAAVALHGVRKMRIGAGDTGLVIGAGPIGNMTAQWLRIHGCARVILADVDARKLELAASMGFETIDSRQSDPVQQLLNLTGGRGAERVVEACGLPATFVQAIACAATFGEVVFMGNLHGDFKIGEKAFSNILRRELRLLGTWNSKVVPRGTDDWSTVLKFMDRDLQIAPLITDTPVLEEGAEIFDSIRKRGAYHNKVIFKVSPQLCE